MQTVTEQPADSETTETTALDRLVDLRRLPVEWLAWGAVLLVALIPRLIGRTNWPLAPGESGIAYDAWQLSQGANISAEAYAHPLLVQASGLLFFLFGATDYTARLVPLAAGIGVVATLFWLRRWFGGVTALATAIVWAISPVMVMSTLRMDGGAVLSLASLLILGAVFVMAVEPGPGKPVVLGVALAAAITTHPIGWLVVLFTLIPALMLIRRPGLREHLLRLGTSFGITFLLLTTWFLSRPSGLGAFFEESFGALWSDYLAALGSDWPLTVLLLIVDEPLMIALAVLGLATAFVRPPWPTSAHPALIISCATWAVPMLTLGILLDGKGPAIYAAMLFPLVLVAGLGLSVIIDGMSTIQRGRIGAVVAWALVAIGLALALFRLAEHLVEGPQDDQAIWLVSIGVLALLFILPLVYAIYRLTPAAGGHLFPVILLLLVAVLAVPALRNSLMLTSTGSDQTREVLLAGATTPAVGELEGRIARYSRDVTAYNRDVSDQTGGHGLILAADDQLRQPLQWYFREFPEFQVISGPDQVDESTQPDMVFVSEENRESLLEALESYQARSYPARFALTSTDQTPDYVSLLITATNPMEFGSLLDFIVRRNGVSLLEYEGLTLLVHEDHVNAFWGGLPE